MQGAELPLSISEMLFHSTLPTIQTGNMLFLVNHHGQSTLLGCALIKNEDIESFKWLFQCWLRCMGGNAPKEILTDQCASMKRAIEACMPTTIHCWCI
ncbi:hypothetical protein Ahy_A10g049390 [Arachis hypogaea]|uniref:Protein FAR1-RELATED SEQUENCE n=1 Tax=Arachis hypogaea TaxID=3818 RepID=A0A445B728_ARAHY|nr:hypothetical protein Ahy_A10g049390 [Arachis hypogaea]